MSGETRKRRIKWRTKVLGTYKRHKSGAATYRYVQSLREEYAIGMSRARGVTVEFDDGSGWRCYEIIRFPRSKYDEDVPAPRPVSSVLLVGQVNP